MSYDYSGKDAQRNNLSNFSNFANPTTTVNQKIGDN